MIQYNSPDKLPIIGTKEIVPGVSIIEGFDENGEPQYAGETDIDWNSQKPVLKDGKLIYVDECGGEWTLDQCVRVEESDANV